MADEVQKTKGVETRPVTIDSALESQKRGEVETRPATIDSAFRNGSLTAIGVVVGFSLGFLSRWASTPGDWTRSDLVAVTAITLGIALQIKALAELLSRQSLAAHRYDRAVRIFLAGLILVAVGVVLAIFAEILGISGNIL